MSRALVLVVLLSGCTQTLTLTAQAATNMAVGVEIDAIEVRLSGEATGSVVRMLAAPGRFERPFRVAEFAGLAPGRYTLSYRAMRGDVEVLTRETTVVVSASTVRTVLLTRDCRGVACPLASGDPTDTACLVGRCVDETCTEEDPSACGLTRECTVDADCATTVPCAVAHCSPVGACVVNGDDTLCRGGEYCDTTTGCRDVARDRACEAVYESIDTADPAEILRCAHERRLRVCWVDDTSACTTCGCDAYVWSSELCVAAVTCQPPIMGSGCLLPGDRTAPPFSCSPSATLDELAVCVVRVLVDAGYCDGAS